MNNINEVLKYLSTENNINIDNFRFEHITSIILIEALNTKYQWLNFLLMDTGN